MNKTQILKKIQPIFQNNAEVAAVYLFGSQATQKTHSQSDIDLAIFFERRLPKLESYKRLEKYFLQLVRILGTEPDLVDIEQVNLILLCEILTNGDILLENNRDKNRAFVARKAVECIDFQFIAEQCVEGMYRKSREIICG